VGDTDREEEVEEVEKGCTPILERAREEEEEDF
jgi:hypothetical protein